MDETGSKSAPVRYRFGPLARRGLIAGFRGGQLAAVVAALLVGVGILRWSPSAGGLAAAVGAVVLGAAVATWPLSGRTAEEWAPDAFRFLAGRAARHRWTTDDPLGSFDLLAVTFARDGSPEIGMEPRPAEAGTSAVGIMADRGRQAFSAILRVEAPGFLLSSDAEKDRRVADWAGVLASVARDRGPIYRLQWVERSVPDGGAELWRHFETGSRLRPDDPPAASYRQLLNIAASSSLCHGVLLVVSVQIRRARQMVRVAGGGDGGACTVLLREIAALRRRLADAEVGSSPPLAPAAVAAVLRGAIDPDAQVAADAVGATGGWLGTGGAGTGGAGTGSADPPARRPDGPGGRGSDADWVWPWPMASEEHWGYLRTDATWHAVYWVAQWPRSDASADFLAALLLVDDVRRTVSVVMEPIGPAQAARQVEQARTADIADAELRQRGGFLATARRRREAETLAGTEAELADGHAQFRFCGYVSVTTDSREALDVACGRVEQAASQAALELRRCFGDQRRAFVATLPLGYGLA